MTMIRRACLALRLSAFPRAIEEINDLRGAAPRERHTRAAVSVVVYHETIRRMALGLQPHRRAHRAQSDRDAE